MGEALEEEHNWLLRRSDLAVVLEVVHIQNWTSNILVVVLEGPGTSLWMQDCVAAAVEEHCDTDCWTVSAVDLLLAKC
jgi:hypothetical protein